MTPTPGQPPLYVLIIFDMLTVMFFLTLLYLILAILITAPPIKNWAHRTPILRHIREVGDELRVDWDGVKYDIAGIVRCGRGWSESEEVDLGWGETWASEETLCEKILEGNYGEEEEWVVVRL
ncbi:hypothetical protein EX30DRAFT_371839 [Ascodesmis nigricans]|uniref:Uncharacterized protein n=1 Tax=Ascodesmis nigricans TaxID=341454 RepID=A0A4S2MW94_9PEZI|nr:hypothetical protein EX30DRAFT_371839 [Ascodesmis nigricans]